MKKIYAMIVIVLQLSIIGSCKNNNDTFHNDPELSLNPRRSTNTVDPIDLNWKWYENNSYQLYARLNGQNVPLGSVPLPFFSSGSQAGNALCATKYYDKDMFPAEGWELFYKNFGSSVDAPVFPYFILYNRARGLIRLLFYKPDGYNIYTYLLVKLYLGAKDSTDGKAGILTFDSKTQYSLDNADKNEVISALVYAGMEGWCFADFSLSYDPNPENYATLHFDIFGVDNYDLVLDGNINLNQVLNQGSINSSRFGLNTIIDTAATGIQYYKSTSSAISGLQESDSEWAQTLGLGLAEVGCVPQLAAAAGIVSKLLGNSKPSQTLPLQFTGNISLKGKLKNEKMLAYLKKVIIPGSYYDPTLIGEDNIISYLNKPLGIFNFTSKVKVGYKHVDRELAEPIQITALPSGQYYYKAAMGLAEPIKITLNPALDNFIVTRIEAKFVWDDPTLVNLYYTEFKEISDFYRDNNFHTGVKLNVNDAVMKGIKFYFKYHTDPVSFQTVVTEDTFPYEQYKKYLPKIALKIKIERKNSDPNVLFQPIYIMKIIYPDYQCEPCDPRPCVLNTCIKCSTGNCGS